MNSYMQIPGISGDSTDPAHPGWIEILSFRTETRQDAQAGPARKFAWVQKRKDAASEPLHSIPFVDYESIAIDLVDPRGSERITLRRVELRRVFTKAVEADSFAEPGDELELSYESAEYGPHQPHRKPAPAKSAAPPQLFLSVPGIAGTASEPAHRQWIELKRILSLAADGSSHPKQDASNRITTLQRSKEADSGTIRLLKYPDDATDALQRALAATRTFEAVTLDVVHAGALRRFQFEKVSFVQVTRSSADEKAIRDRTDPAGDEVVFIYERLKRQLPPSGKKPTTHPVARAHAAAPAERTTINLRPPKFFELALPVLSGDGGKTVYPPADAAVRLVSDRGYDRRYPISAGMTTPDGFCSFRFHDISEKATDELFTATLERGTEVETIFKDRRVATYIAAARKNGPYEPAFPPGPESVNLSR